MEFDSKFNQNIDEPATTTVEVQNLENNELLNTATPKISEILTNIFKSVAHANNNRLLTTKEEVIKENPKLIATKPSVESSANSSDDIFRYMKGTVYDNIQHLWRSKLFEQKLASTRISVYTQPPLTTTTTTTTAIAASTTIINTAPVSNIIKNVVSTSPFSQASIDASTKYNLKNYSNAFSLTFNLMKSNPSRNLTANLNKGIHRFTQTVNNNYDAFNENTSMNSFNNFSLHQQNHHYNIGIDNNVAQISGGCNCSKTLQPSFFDEYTNVWKLSFFVLAFVIGFVSLFLLLSLIFKVLM